MPDSEPPIAAGWRPRCPAAWAAIVFAVALAARVGFVLVVDQPLLYSHQYNYFRAALALSEHPDVVRYVLTSDEWRTWNGHWTIAPGYHLLAAAVFRLFGPHLLPLQLLQCVLDALAAVGVGWLGRAVAGRHGAWAGVAYAVHWPAVEMPSWTMTENAHTVLLVAGVAWLVRTRSGSRGQAFAGGLLLGFAALARSVTSAFVALAAAWRWLGSGAPRRLDRGVLVGLGAACLILPWTARNVFLVGDAVLIESAAFENLWYTNCLVEDAAQRRRQLDAIHDQETPAAKRAAVLHFVARGLREHPERFLPKVVKNFWHLLRPEGLQNWLGIERSLEPWRHLATLLLDDVPFLLALPPFLVFAAAGRPSPARRLMLLWVGYYLLMIVVVFHNEIRYRSALTPFLFAGAAGGVATLADAERRRRWPVLFGGALGVYLAGASVAPYVVPALERRAASQGLEPALAAVDAGRVGQAWPLARAAAARAPRSAWPWSMFAERLLRDGHRDAAAEAFRLAAARAGAATWEPTLGLARLRGPGADGVGAVREAHRLSWRQDPWLVLEVAWEVLPPPTTDRLQLGGNDYGAVRGFYHPRGVAEQISGPKRNWYVYAADEPEPPPGRHRWTRERAEVRLIPADAATRHRVVVDMGAPFPCPLAAPVVRVRINGVVAGDIALGPAIDSYAFEADTPPSQPLLLRLEAPTWNRIGEPAEQGVRVDSVRLEPLG